MDKLFFLNPRLEILVAGRTVVNDHWDSLRSLHRDGYSRLYYIKEGRGRIDVSGKEISLGKGQFVIIPRGAVFKLDEGKGVDHIWIHFDITTREGLPLFDLIRLSSFSRAASEREVLYLTQIMENWSRPENRDFLASLPLLNLLLIPFWENSLPAVDGEDRPGPGHWLYRALALP